MKEEFSLEEVLKGKATTIKNKSYRATREYVEPFLDRMSKFTSDFNVHVKMPDQITVTKDGDVDVEDITFNRVWVEAVLPDEYAFNNHKEVVGMVYGLDVRKPVVKFYRGGMNMACTNLCVFNPEMLHVCEFDSEAPINYKPVDYIMEQTDDMKNWLEYLNNTNIETTTDNINRLLGMWVRKTLSKSYDVGFGKVKLACSTPIEAYKLLFEKEDSPYYYNKAKEVNMFDVYNAFTQIITDTRSKDVMNACEKTLLLRDILDLSI